MYRRTKNQRGLGAWKRDREHTYINEIVTNKLGVGCDLAVRNGETPAVTFPLTQPGLFSRRFSGIREDSDANPGRIRAFMRNSAVGLQPPEPSADIVSINGGRPGDLAMLPRFGFLSSREMDR
jgi:hypothetical protein